MFSRIINSYSEWLLFKSGLHRPDFFCASSKTGLLLAYTHKISREPYVLLCSYNFASSLHVLLSEKHVFTGKIDK